MDRPPAIEELLSHRAWLRRLASSLVLDAARADDVVQETLLAALRRPPADAGRPQAWLASVARRIARGFTRRDEGRERHERGAAQPEAQPATDVVVARAALQQRVAAIVLELDEPYRTALLLRYVEELPPRAIARRTSVPVETARTRVRRGVELVRARLLAPEDLVVLLAPRERKSLAVALAAPATTGAALLEASVAGGVVMSSGAKLAAAALLVAAASAGWWATARFAEPARDESGAGSAATAATADGSKTAANDGALPIAGERVATKPMEAGEPALGSDAWLAQLGLTVTPAPEDGLPVELVDAVSGRPAAGVAVMQLVSGVRREWISPGRANELLDAPRQFRRLVLEVHRTDGEGRTRVGYWPAMTHRVLVALEGRRRAVAGVGAPPLLPLVLRLREAAALDVEVVDRDGAPCSRVAVGIAQGASENPYLDDSAVLTDGDGRARLLDIDLLASHASDTGHRVAVGCGLGMTPAAQAPFDLDDLPTEPIVLTIAESGAVEIELVDGDGRRLPFSGFVSCQLQRSEARSFWLQSMQVSFADGVATIDPIGLGMDWDLWPVVGDHRLKTWRGSGPRQDAETVRAKLTCESAGPVLIARLVDEERVPLADRDVHAIVRTVGANDSAYGNRVRTDADGGFRFAVPSIELACFRRTLLLQLSSTAARPPCRAYLPLPALLPRANVDLGDVVARPLEATLAGRVVRDDGAPLAKVEVGVEWLDRKPTEMEREEFGFSEVSSDDDGRFELIGWPPGRYRVRLSADGYSPARELPADSTLTLPARDLVFTLSPARPAGNVVLGSVVVDGLPRDRLADLRVRFRRAGGDKPGEVVAEAEIDPRGAFQWIAKEKGRFDAEVAPLGNQDPLDYLARVESVVVDERATIVDPRLQQIELDGNLRAIAITVVDESRRPVQNVLIATRIAGSAEAAPRFAWSGEGTLQLLTRQAALDVEVFASGGRSAARRGVSGPIELVLAPGNSVAATIRLVPAALASDPRLVFNVSAFPDGAKLDGVAAWLTATIGADGAATLALPPLPRWRLRLMVQGREGRNRLHRDQLPKSEKLLELDPAGSAAEVTLEVDPAVIEAFAQRMSDE